MEYTTILWLLLALFCCLVLVVMGYVCYAFIYRRYLYRHIPGPPITHFIKGNAVEMLKMIANGYPLDEYLLNCHKAYGPVVCIWLFHEPLLSVTTPELVRETLAVRNFPKSSKLFQCGVRLFGARLAGHGLITNFDHENWLVRRETLNPAFHRRYLKNIMPIFNECCAAFENKLARYADGRTRVKLLDEICPLTLDVLSRAAYGTDFQIVNNPDSPFPTAFNLTMSGMEMFVFNPLHWLDFRTFPFQRKVVEACKFLRKTGNDMLVQRRRDIEAGKEVPSDLLTFIVKSGEKLSDILTDVDLIDELVTFFYAGHETTARTLAFTFMELGFHPEVMEKLVSEITSVLPPTGDVTMEHLNKLQYTWLCLRETLRLYPIAAGLRRYINTPCELGGYQIPDKTDLYVSSYVSARMPGNFEDAKEYRPERWLSEEVVVNSRLTQFPFSVGYRTCIGQTFAMMETKTLLARILRKYVIDLVPGHSKKITQRITIQPRDMVECFVSKREWPQTTREPNEKSP